MFQEETENKLYIALKERYLEILDETVEDGESYAHIKSKDRLMDEVDEHITTIYENL